LASLAPPEHKRRGFEAYQSVLDQVCAIIPPDLVITLLADRGFVHDPLLHYLAPRSSGTDILRLKSSTLLHLPGQPASAVKDLYPPGFREPLH
jgi:hypothetical protein